MSLSLLFKNIAAYIFI